MATPHPPPHMRLTYTGFLGTTAAQVEQFSFGINFDLGPTADVPTPSERSTFLSAALTAYTTNINPRIGAAAKLTRVRLAQVNDDGKTARETSGQYKHTDLEVAALTGGATTLTPYQIALAVSLQSAMPGPTGKGRFFLPVPNLSGFDAGTGTIDDATRDVWATGCRDFLIALNQSAGNLWTGSVAVASGGSASRGLPAAMHKVTHVGVGRAPDTMRSRRRDLSESRELVSLT